MRTNDRIGMAMERAIEEGVFPGAVLLVRAGGCVVYHRAFGLATRLPDPVTTTMETVYDLASLTKVLATTSAILVLIQEGKLTLDHRIDHVLRELNGCPVGRATVGHLLNHSAGLPSWRPFYRRIAAQDHEDPGFLGSANASQAVMDFISQEELAYPIGTRNLYSDLGFILLGFMVERVTGQSLAEFCQDRLYLPLKATPLFFIPTIQIAQAESTWKDEWVVAATEDDPWRGRILRGEVHDENAYAMGGVAGHAGLFGTASAILGVSGGWLDGYNGQDGPFAPELVRQFVRRQNRSTGSSWALGWDTPSAPSSAGERFSPSSFGHLGFTGTSLWVDPLAELEVVLLTNRVHPSRKNNLIQNFRPLIHNIIHQECVGHSSLGTSVVDS